MVPHYDNMFREWCAKLLILWYDQIELKTWLIRLLWHTRPTSITFQPNSPLFYARVHIRWHFNNNVCPVIYCSNFKQWINLHEKANHASVKFWNSSLVYYVRPMCRVVSLWLTANTLWQLSSAEGFCLMSIAQNTKYWNWTKLSGANIDDTCFCWFSPVGANIVCSLIMLSVNSATRDIVVP